ncbi:hypothetical protein [Nonomuraea aurantiaca]|uniref:hypothetical protein n=1 Tax=Nonomuraea aurantiaca TaxID=2878562 RepID=UPI001CD9DD08|nr:hypothetical protein [Nonomuraea aurantiaca]MCA2227221.1 hypothetical protein [Nonomuraea aurantiaca]
MRRARAWQVVVAGVGLAMGVAGFVLWLRGAQSPGLAGQWTGSADTEPGFPVAMELADGGSALRWGAGLRCSGRLSPTRGRLVFALDRVRGEGCVPGTLRVFPTPEPDQVVIKMTRQGDTDITYSGTLSRHS